MERRFSGGFRIARWNDCIMTENYSFGHSLERVKKPFKVNSGYVYQCAGFLASGTRGPISDESLPYLLLGIRGTSSVAWNRRPEQE
jgi:hypothetical protein